ncbi:DUF4251 domain-containing protein [Winogradskyella luteola]|uniref:DUF4251 domain-containing protein n=1 Tax=Winogradskyella luteola TaxID=2828330 RepID=A0A9X1F6P6_9FLAO|nr:DUF4251 domain-containing protein [Winogradskyella luteola]MBV7268244.1 DUF4251 domain-containing protein [Winogradskyella luteola]
MKYLIILILLFSFSATNLVSAQSKETQKEQFQSTYNAMKALVKAKEFKYVGEVVFKADKRQMLDSTTNILTVNQAYSSGSLSTLDSITKGIQVDGEISNYIIDFNDDSQQISVQFSVNNMEIYIDIKPNGNAFLTVKGTVNKITQRGKLKSI